jgi:hypothetical protein
LYASSLSKVPQAAGSRVAVHPGVAAVEQDRPARAHSGRPAVFFAEVGDVGAGGFEDPQAQQAEHDYQREVIPVR